MVGGRQRYEAGRRGAAHRKLYKDPRWEDLRIQTFTRDGWRCRRCGCYCLGKGRKHPQSPICDHVKPHRGDERLFFDPLNLQTLCKQCHDGAKQSEEVRGFSTEVGEDGWPIDIRHPANGQSIK